MAELHNFKLIFTSKPDACAKVRKYKSTESGLTVIIADVAGPLVSGYFTLATEAYDDDGLPHTLEHLIFIGSEKYPYKGVLDLFANRNLASGTNAWTDVDHTCYTITTAGSEGFLNLLPVYVDHILYPTLTDSAYITEVHHIDGGGNDAGIVYCEMQGSENSGESRAFRELLRAAYPGRCGYKSEIGGVLQNLRESTSNQKVKDYHKAFYRPENLTLIIVGHIDDEDVLKSLIDVETKAKNAEKSPFQRPWQGEVPPLLKSIDKLVLYADDDEDNGMVYVAWRGPSAISEVYEMSACTILLRYLTESSISPLQKEFVEIADPLASCVRYSIQENSISLLYASFDNVPLAKLSEVKPRLDAKLKEFISGDEKIDMKRLRTLIHRQRLEVLLNLETQPHNAICFLLIGDLLHGHTDEQLDQRLNPTVDLDRMDTESEDFWLKLLNQYLVSAPSVTVRGQPSIAEASKLAQEEEMRISSQIEALGPAGLKVKAEELENAIHINERPPPVEMLVSNPVPDPGLITFHDVKTFSSESSDKPKQFNILDIPQFAHVDDLDSKFVYLAVLMDTSAVPEDLRFYIPIYLEAMLESAILRDGVLIPYETVVGELEQDTIAAQTSIGIYSDERFDCGPYGQTVALTIQVESSKYERGVEWLHELLFCTKFCTDRLYIIAAKIVNAVSEFRRKGYKIAWDMMWNISYKKDCNKSVNNLIRQHKFVSEFGKKLNEIEDGQDIIAKIEKLREILTNPSNLTVRVSGKLDALSSQIGDVAKPWKNLLPKDVTAIRQKLKVIRDTSLLIPANEKSGAWILGLGSNDSNYLCQSIRCIDDYKHPDYPALLVFLQYLTQLEGPMWKQIRGTGLSYSYGITPRVTEGLLHLSFFKSTNIVSAYNEARQIVEYHLNGTASIDNALLDSAKCSMIFQIIQKEGTLMDKVRQNVLSYFHNNDLDHNRNLVKKLALVTPADMLRVGKQYVTPLFDPTKVKMTLACHPNKVADLRAAFAESGFKVNDCKSLNEFFLEN